MDPTARRFVLASVAWLLVGSLLGLAMAWPGAYPSPVPGGRPLPAHAHIQVFGFVTMMIFGVALHILPRFEGRPLPSRRVAEAQWAAANAGLLLFAAGQLFAREWLIAAGGSLMALSVLAFVWQIARLLARERGERAP
ncbi:MAG TPA: cbb3-type cytochrome c oxidase subunit I [Bacillota bacterium]